MAMTDLLLIINLAVTVAVVWLVLRREMKGLTGGELTFSKEELLQYRSLLQLFKQHVDEADKGAFDILEGYKQERIAMNSLLEEAKRQIGELRALSEVAQAKSATPVVLKPAMRVGATDRVSDQAVETAKQLVSQGVEPDEISRRTGVSRGDIDLIVNLRKFREGDR